MVMKIKIQLGIILFGISMSLFAHPIIDKYQEAAHQFDTLIKEQLALGTMPRLGEPQNDLLINLLTDSSLFLSQPNYQVEDISQLINICDTTSRINKAYYFHGMEFIPVKDQNMQVKLIHSNMKKYSKELIKFQSFNIHCAARVIPLFEQRLQLSALNRAELEFIRYARDNIVELYISNIMLFDNASGLPLNYRLRLLQAVTDASPQLAVLVPLQLRSDLVRYVNDLKYWHAPMPVKDQINRLLGLLQTDRCDKLCQL